MTRSIAGRLRDSPRHFSAGGDPFWTGRKRRNVVSEKLQRVPALITVDVKYGDAVLASAQKMVLVCEAQSTIEELLREALEKSRFGTLGLHTSVTLEQESDEYHDGEESQPSQSGLYGH
jgi:hypothetical protein